MKQALVIGTALVALFSSCCRKTALTPNRAQVTETRLSGDVYPPIGAVALPFNRSVPDYTLIRAESQRQPSPPAYWGTRMTVLMNGVPVDYYFDKNGLPANRPTRVRDRTARRLTAAQLLSSVSNYLGQTDLD